MHNLRYTGSVAAFLVLVTYLGSPGVCAAAEGSPDGNVNFSYTLKEPGFVSAVIYDGQGAMVRTLLYAQKQEAGNHRLSWDGLNSYGQPQPPGGYEYRLLRTPGFTNQFLLDLGVNITWREHDYWPGNHYGPNCVMVDGVGGLYVGSVSSEGPPHIIKLSQDGRQLYWSTGTWGFKDGLVDMARIDRVLYILMGDGTLQILMADKGGLPWSDPKLHRLVASETTRGKFADLRHPREKKDQKQPAMRLAGGRDFLVVCYHDFNEVRLLWPKDDKFQRDETVTVPRPTAAAVAPDGRVFVRSGKRIVTFSDSARQVRTLVEDKALLESGPLAYDPAFDDILVGNGGHVRRYHAAGGKQVAVYGRTEGRTYGVFNPLDFDGILSLAADGKGGFFTVELCPRRVAHFTGREKHELVAQWFGGMAWEAQAVLDPADPTIAFVPIDYKHLGRAVIDYQKRTWTLTHLYDTPETFSWGVNATDQHGGVFPGLTGWKTYFHIHHVEGETYLVYLHDSVMVLRVDEKANRIVPVAELRSLHPTNDRRNPPRWWIKALRRIGIDADDPTGPGTDNPRSFAKAGGYSHFGYTWSDTNRNGRFDVEEVVLSSAMPMFNGGYYFVDDDWNIYAPGGPDNSAWTLFRNEGKDKRYPAWNWDHRLLFNSECPEKMSATAVYAARDGSVYAAGKYADTTTQDLPPTNWPNNAVTSNRFMKWDRQGRLMFATGFHAAEKIAPPGGFSDLRAFVGEARGNIVIRDACAHAMVWTADGLYAGNISKHLPDFDNNKTRDKPSDGPWSDDCWNGQIIETPKGEVLWCANEMNSTMVIRVDGWDWWERQSGAIYLTTVSPSAQRQGDGLKAEYFNNVNLAGAPVLKRVDPALWFGPLWGAFREIPTIYPWTRRGEIARFDPANCSVRWTGFIESPFSEDVTFHGFVYGREQKKVGAKLRMWVDDKLVIDSWDGYTLIPDDGQRGPTRFAKSSPVPMKAGKHTPVKIEYAAAGGTKAHFHLYWESRSLEQRHVPQTALYSKP